jgi:hypothetical protein
VSNLEASTGSGGSGGWWYHGNGMVMVLVEYGTQTTGGGGGSQIDDGPWPTGYGASVVPVSSSSHILHK